MACAQTTHLTARKTRMSKTPCSLSSIQAALYSGDLQLTDVVEFYIAQIKENKHLNAFNTIYEEEALLKARKIQLKIKDKDAGVLAGLVIGLKDNIAFKDHPLQASSKILNGFESIYNATVTERLINEDAIIIGSLNCDEFAMGSTNENSHFGPVLNPHDESRVPGGSSGGSAVAVAKDMCLVSLGTDTGGSVRMPAAYCGVLGLKPTYGRISRYGIIAYASSFDQIGIFAKNTEDCAKVLSVIAGEDPKDATSSKHRIDSYDKHLFGDKKYSIAFLKDCIETDNLDTEIRTSFKLIDKALKNSGHQTNKVDFELIDYLVPAYYILTTAEASSNLARYDGIHFGHRSNEAQGVENTYIHSRSEGFGAEVKRRIMLGTFVLSSGYYDAYYNKAKRVRRMIKEATEKILDTHDFIILPCTTDTAFKIGEKIDDPVKMYLSDIYTVQANLVGIPAISIPLFKHSNGMPFGLQIMSKRFCENELLAFSKQLLDKFENSSIPAL